MIETNLMRGWAGVVESAALFALAILGICLIVSAVKPADAVKHLAAIICCTILLLILPAIMMAAWSSMTSWQHFGIVILGTLVGLSLLAMRDTRKKR